MISKGVQEAASEISQTFYHTDPLFMTVAMGGRPYASSLIQKLRNCTSWACENIEVRTSSYDGTERGTMGPIEFMDPLDTKRIYGRDIVVLDDIFETGSTMKAIHEMLDGMGAKSVTYSTLIYRVYGQIAKNPSLISAFDVHEDDFLVGYGMDMDGEYRNDRNISRVVFTD